ncbi:MAG TPA: head-tail connector protein [Trueperaceae bacterium]
MHTAVQTRLAVTTDEAKAYLRVDGSDEDTLIEGLVKAAKAAADAFLNNPFQDAAGADQAIPDDVRIWVLRRVAFLYEQRVENVRADELQGVGVTDYGRAISDRGGSLDYALIRPYRLNPGL